MALLHNSSIIWWKSALIDGETGLPGEIQRPVKKIQTNMMLVNNAQTHTCNLR